MALNLRRQVTESGGEVDIAPLIDVVFLLIIFFMSIWQAAHTEVQADLNLPFAAQADPTLQQDQDRLIVNIDRDGDYYVASRRLDPEQLMGLLRAETARSSDAEGFAERPVFIRADAILPFKDVRDVMLMCREARVWKLTLRTRGEAKEEEP